jgi:hypothetical protein
LDAGKEGEKPETDANDALQSKDKPVALEVLAPSGRLVLGGWLMISAWRGVRNPRGVLGWLSFFGGHV